MSHKHKAGLIGLRPSNLDFLCYIPNFIRNHPRPKSKNLRYEAILLIIHNIRVFMTIIKDCFYVYCEWISILNHHMANCQEGNPISPEMQPWQDHRFKVVPQTLRDLFTEELLCI